MGKTWKKKVQRARKGKPHRQRPRGVGELPNLKTERALRQELEIQRQRFNQPQQREA